MTAMFCSAELNRLAGKIRKAAVSVPLNIADGDASGYNKDFNQFFCLYPREDLQSREPGSLL
ncbi:MAG: four helix bundle protein [Bacteroidales bacterium]